MKFVKPLKQNHLKKISFPLDIELILCYIKEINTRKNSERG